MSNKKLKLYLISQDDNTGWDTYDSAVVVAESPKEAQHMDPAEDGAPMKWGADRAWYRSDWATKPESVKVKYLGPAKRGVRVGVVCSSFNAG